MKKYLIPLMLLTVRVAMAAEEAHVGHEESHIPLQEIGWQAVNLGILLVILIYFARKPIIEAFANRKKNFIEQSEKTRADLMRAEAELADIKAKLATLEAGEEKSLENSNYEANVMRAHMISDAETQAAKIKADAELTIKNDLLKAREEVNRTILKNAVDAAKQKMATSSPQAMKSMESTFLASVDEKSMGAGL